MSVRSEKRTISKAEFLNMASEMHCDTTYLATRLSNRMKRTVGDALSLTAHNVVAELYSANKIRIEDQISFNLRRGKLLNALAGLDTFEVDLNLVYSVLRRNPEGAYRTEHGRTMKPAEAMESIDKRVTRIVEQKEAIEKMVKAIVKKDKEKFPEYYNSNTK